MVVDTTRHGKSIKMKLQEGYDLPDSAICEVEVPSQFSQAPGSGIEDVFSKNDFAKLLAHTAHTPEADFATLANRQYMRKKTVVPKRVVAHTFNKGIVNFSENDFEEGTLANMRRLLDFCANDAWFFPAYYQ